MKIIKGKDYCYEGFIEGYHHLKSKNGAEKLQLKEFKLIDEKDTRVVTVFLQDGTSSPSYQSVRVLGLKTN